MRPCRSFDEVVERAPAGLAGEPLARVLHRVVEHGGPRVVGASSWRSCVTLSAQMSRPMCGLAELDLLDDRSALEPVVLLEVLLLAVVGDRVVAASRRCTARRCRSATSAADCAAAALALPDAASRATPCRARAPATCSRRRRRSRYSGRGRPRSCRSRPRQRLLVLAGRLDPVRVQRLAAACAGAATASAASAASATPSASSHASPPGTIVRAMPPVYRP